MGFFLHRQGRFEESCTCFDRAFAFGNRDVRVVFEFGAGKYALGRYGEAARAFGIVLQSEPDHAGAHYYLGMAEAGQGAFDPAIAHLDRAAALDPASGAADRLWRTKFLAGRWQEAWADHDRILPADLDQRWRESHGTGHRHWQGQSLDGQELVVFRHGGHGDMIHYLRFLDRVLALHPARLTLMLPESLHRLVAASPLLAERGRTEVALVAPDRKLEDRPGYFIWFEGLAAFFRAEPGTLGPWQPYLAAEPARVLHWAGRLGPHPRVGLAWRGAPGYPEDRWRSIPLEQLRPLLHLPDLHWVILQKAPLSQEERAILGALPVTDLSDALDDFAETAAIMANLDLVISVDSAPAHLAGAMGLPVLLLNRASSEWRWGWKQETSFWYPTMRIFNQRALGDWSGVPAGLEDALAAWARPG